jgi:hypothetical protein
MAGNMSTGTLVVAPGVRCNGVKVFSSTMVAQRAVLGESSDSRFHCVSIAVFFSEAATSPRPRAR